MVLIVFVLESPPGDNIETQIEQATEEQCAKADQFIVRAGRTVGKRMKHELITERWLRVGTDSFPLLFCKGPDIFFGVKLTFR